MAPSSEVTRLLAAFGRGNREAFDRVMPLLYEELRRLARARLRQEKTGHTLDTTSLVHEAYLRLVDVREVDWESRRHFLSMAARVMRRILVDHARRRRAARRGGAPLAVTLDEESWVADGQEERVLEVHEALERLEADHPRAAQAVEQRFFVGLTTPEIAEALQVSVATVERDLRFARAWLTRALGDPEGG